MQPLEGFLIQEGIASPLAILKALNVQRELSVPIGQIALAEETLTIPQISNILERQAECHKKFGEWAIELGYLTQNQVNRLLAIQSATRPPLTKILVEIGGVDKAAMEAVLGRYEMLNQGK